MKATCGQYNISQLLDKKFVTNVKTPQHSDSFSLSITKIISKNNLPLQGEEIELDDSEKCQRDKYKNLSHQ